MRMIAGILARDEGQFVYSDIVYPCDKDKADRVWGGIIENIQNKINDSAIRNMWLLHYIQDKPYYRSTDWMLRTLSDLPNCRVEEIDPLQSDPLPEDKRIYVITRYPLKDRDMETVFRIQREIESVRVSSRHFDKENAGDLLEELQTLLGGLGYSKIGIEWRLRMIFGVEGRIQELDELRLKEIADEHERLHTTKCLAEPPRDVNLNETEQKAFSLTALRIAGGTFLRSPIPGCSTDLLQQYTFSTPFFACPYNAPDPRSIRNQGDTPNTAANLRDDLLNQLFSVFRTWGIRKADDDQSLIKGPENDLEAQEIFKTQEVFSSGFHRIPAYAQHDHRQHSSNDHDLYFSQIYLVSLEEMSAWLLLWNVLVSKSHNYRSGAEHNATSVENMVVRSYAEEAEENADGHAMENLPLISTILDYPDEKLFDLYLTPILRPFDQLMHLAYAAEKLELARDDIVDSLHEAVSYGDQESRKALAEIVNERLDQAKSRSFDDCLRNATGIYFAPNEVDIEELRGVGRFNFLASLLKFAHRLADGLLARNKSSCVVEDIHKLAPFPLLPYAYWWNLYRIRDHECGIRRPIHMVSAFGPPSLSDNECHKSFGIDDLFEYYFVMGIDSSLSDLSIASIRQIISLHRTLTDLICGPAVKRMDIERRQKLSDQQVRLVAAVEAAETARKFGSGIAHNTMKMVASLTDQENSATRATYVNYVLNQMHSLRLAGQGDDTNRCMWAFIDKRNQGVTIPRDVFEQGCWYGMDKWLKGQCLFSREIIRAMAGSNANSQYIVHERNLSDLDLSKVLGVTVDSQCERIMFPRSDKPSASEKLAQYTDASSGLGVLQMIVQEMMLNALKGCRSSICSERYITANASYVNDDTLILRIENTGESMSKEDAKGRLRMFADCWTHAKFISEFRESGDLKLRGLSILATIADDQHGLAEFQVGYSPQNSMYWTKFILRRKR